MSRRAIDIIAEVVRNGQAIVPTDEITKPMWRVFRALRRAGEITWYFLYGYQTTCSGTYSTGVYTVSTITSGSVGYVTRVAS